MRLCGRLALALSTLEVCIFHNHHDRCFIFCIQMLVVFIKNTRRKREHGTENSNGLKNMWKKHRDTTSKALVTSSVALVTSSVALVTTSKAQRTLMA